MIFPHGIGDELLFELALTVLAQCPNQWLRKRDCSFGGAGLGLMQREPAVYSLQRAPDGEPTAVKVNIRPFQAERLAPTQPDTQRDGPQGREPMRPGHREEPSRLLDRQRGDLSSGCDAEFDQPRDVAFYQLFPGRGL